VEVNFMEGRVKMRRRISKNGKMRRNPKNIEIEKLRIKGRISPYIKIFI